MKKFIRPVIASVMFVCALFCVQIFAKQENNTVVRATVDIGSGATKLRVAEIDLKSRRIIKVLESQVFAVSYQEHLALAKDGNFDREVMEIGMKALKDSKEIAKKYNAEKVIAVATAAFRKAKNADKFIAQIKAETDIDVNIIDQQLEGELAFQAVCSQFGLDPQKLIVWDIGGGSFQLTALNNDGEYEIYRGHEASVPFKNHVITAIQKQDCSVVSTPNPINYEQSIKAQFYAMSVAEDVNDFFLEKIQDKEVTIVGVGNILGLQIPRLIDGDKLTQDLMIGEVAKLINKNDQEVGGGSFANVVVTNTLLVLGFMKELAIDNMQLADVNPSDGAFFYNSYWE